MNSKRIKKSRVWIEDYSCPCCDLFWTGWVEQQLNLHWKNANALYQDLREVMQEGFARYAYPLLGRLIELEPRSRRVSRISRLRLEQLDKPSAPVIGSLP
jgi:hypothetical protein